MLKVTWRNLVARKLRLLLSAFAIVLVDGRIQSDSVSDGAGPPPSA